MCKCRYEMPHITLDMDEGILWVWCKLTEEMLMDFPVQYCPICGEEQKHLERPNV